MAMPGEEIRTPRRRLIAFYVILGLLTAGVISVSIGIGQGEDPEPVIAGGYDLAEPDRCLGTGFDLKQSGRFVAISNPDGTLSGNLTFRGGTLEGDLDCVDGETRELRAAFVGELAEGTIDGEAFAASFERDPPPPGTRDPIIPGAVDGEYDLEPRSQCLGGSVEIEEEDGQLELLAGDHHAGELSYEDGVLEGRIECVREGGVTLRGEAKDRTLDLRLEPAEAAPLDPERLTATKEREFEHLLGAFFIAIAVVMLVARLVGLLAVKVGQPRVMGEVLGGILLGPTAFGAIAPNLQATLFPADVIPIMGVVANLGLIFFMFLVGLELDARQLKGRVAQALAISNMSIALPMALGIAAAIPIYNLVAPDTGFIAFALFMGVAMSITAFPVLARILVERRMLKGPVGALAMAAAAFDDVTAWFLIALALAVAVAGTGGEVAATIGLAAIFCLIMFLGVRPLFARVSRAYDEAGRVPSGWIAAIFAGILLAAYATETIGIALIFGAFVMGLVMPRHAELTEDVTGRLEDFVVILLLPLFFAYTGLRTDFGLLDRPELILLTVALLAIAIIAKLAGAMIAARVSGLSWRASGVIGTLMNTRGLTELIVLNLALEAGVISEALFAALVIMALVTTFMAGPLLRLIDPRNEFGAAVTEEFEEAARVSQAEFPAITIPDRSILVASESEGALVQLRGLAEPLARSEPPRELILARLVRPPRAAAAGVRGGLQTENRLVGEATERMRGARDELIGKGIAARAVAFISTDAGGDLTRVAERQDVDLVLIDGARPLLGEGVPRGDVGQVLEGAPCDVAVLVAPEDAALLAERSSPLIVPFGGSEHDWAALELGAWLSAATGMPLKLLGAAGTSEETSRLTRLLADAGLLVQGYAGVTAEPLISEPGKLGVVEAAADAGLLVIGLSDRWREDGLGPTRSEIARAAPAPVVFVRRGTRPGALAPREDQTRFTWSVAGMARPTG